MINALEIYFFLALMYMHTLCLTSYTHINCLEIIELTLQPKIKKKQLDKFYGRNKIMKA